MRAYRDAGVKHIVALRGDPEGGIGTAYAPHPDGYASSADLVAGIRAIGDFEVSVSAYPEKHPESPSLDADIDMLKRKVDAGADRAITQFFFDNDRYEAYVEKVRAAGLDIPIVPGIVPVHNFAQVARFAAGCGASVPDWLAAPLRRARGRCGDPPARRRGGRRRAGARPRRPRRHRFPLLHDEPRRPRLRDLPPPRHAAGQGGAGAGGGRGVTKTRDPGGAEAVNRRPHYISGIDHVQIAVPEGQEQACRDFYLGVLGMREIEAPRARRGPKLPLGDGRRAGDPLSA